jgi:hypothetical protein
MLLNLAPALVVTGHRVCGIAGVVVQEFSSYSILVLSLQKDSRKILP